MSKNQTHLEYTIYADDIFDFKTRLNKFFEENPTVEIRWINSPTSILKEDETGLTIINQ